MLFWMMLIALSESLLVSLWRVQGLLLGKWRSSEALRAQGARSHNKPIGNHGKLFSVFSC